MIPIKDKVQKNKNSELDWIRFIRSNDLIPKNINVQELKIWRHLFENFS